MRDFREFHHRTELTQLFHSISFLSSSHSYSILSSSSSSSSSFLSSSSSSSTPHQRRPSLGLLAEAAGFSLFKSHKTALVQLMAELRNRKYDVNDARVGAEAKTDAALTATSAVSTTKTRRLGLQEEDSNRRRRRRRRKKLVENDSPPQGRRRLTWDTRLQNIAGKRFGFR